jgi:type IV pilus assembly protein PilB
MTLLEYLVDKGMLNDAGVNAVRSEIDKNGLSFEEALKHVGLTAEQVITAKSEYFGVPIKSIGDETIPFEILRFVPEDSALHYGFVPIGLNEGFLEIGILDPDNLEARDALNFISAKVNLPYKLFLISSEDFENIIKIYKGLSGEVTKALSEFDTDQDIGAENEGEKGKEKIIKQGQTTIIEDAPVTKIVSTILRYAVEGSASDVHIEPLRDKIRVRFRVDGVLNTTIVLPAKVLDAVVARIKILANMKLDEKRKPQDGRFPAKIEGRKVDFRVSTFPTYYGEKVVMRILDQQKGVQSIENIGLSEKNLNMLLKAIDRPYGMILISGPTGSGKTTTLYSILKKLDSEHDNILSLEDPVEYTLEGISQSQVKPEIGYTFASGLRTTLRQDPDIIMVGEIRDKETAQLAIQAALTGHLVFSTIHTNTACGIVPRLIDMGVDPYLIPPTLILGIAQRLTRKICPNSGKPRKVEGALKTRFEEEFKDLPEEFKKDLPPFDEVLEASPTSDCPSGMRGREAVFEMYEMSPELEDRILKNPLESAIYEVVRKQGMITLKEDAIIKAVKKIIPFEEVNKL